MSESIMCHDIKKNFFSTFLKGTGLSKRLLTNGNIAAKKCKLRLINYSLLTTSAANKGRSMINY